MENTLTEKCMESKRNDAEIQKTDTAAIKFKFKFESLKEAKNNSDKKIIATMDRKKQAERKRRYRQKLRDVKLQNLSKEKSTSQQIPPYLNSVSSLKQNNYRLNIDSIKEGDILLQQTPIMKNCNQKELTVKTPTEMETVLTEKIMQKKRNHAERQRRYRQKLKDAKLNKIAEEGLFSQLPTISPKTEILSTNQNKNRFDINNNKVVEGDPLPQKTPTIIDCKQKTTTGNIHTDREIALIKKFRESNRKHVERNRRYRQKLKDAKLHHRQQPHQHHHHDHRLHNQMPQQEQFQKQQCQVKPNLLPVQTQHMHQQEAVSQKQQKQQQAHQQEHQKENKDSCQKTAFANFLSMVTSTIISMRKNGQPIEVIVKNNELMSCSKFQE